MSIENEREISNSVIVSSGGEFKLVDLPVEFFTGVFSRLGTLRRYGRIYIIKGLNPDVMGSLVYVEMLRKEFELLSMLDHPNIVHALSMEDIAGWGRVIVMEYVDGVTLKEYLTEINPEPMERIVLGRQLIDAIAYAHQMGVTHRDLKPDNVMVTRRGGRVKVIDFGLGDSDSHTFMKLSRGTASYGAPEQQEISGEAAPEPVDVYSLGRLLQTLNLPHRYGGVIKRCLAREADKRPPIERLLSMYDSVEGRRHRRSIVGLTSVAALIAGVAVWLAMDRGDREVIERVITSSPEVRIVHDTIMPDILVKPERESTKEVVSVPAVKETMADDNREFDLIYDRAWNEIKNIYEQVQGELNAEAADNIIDEGNERWNYFNRFYERSNVVVEEMKTALAEKGASNRQISQIVSSMWLDYSGLYTNLVNSIK